jgi:hypothetical protein
MANDRLTTRDLAGTHSLDAEDAKVAAHGASDEDEARVDGNERGLEGGSPDEQERATGDERERSTTSSAASADEDDGPLLPRDQSERFTTRWHEIQTSFVDEPREAVTQADALVADLMQRLAASFSNERERLEAQWDRGGDVSTEDLRVALTRYRSFFGRLLSA